MDDAAGRTLHHSLLNHIAVISTYLELLGDSDLDEEQRELLAELSEATRMAHELATELGLKLELDGGSDDGVAENGEPR